MGRARSANTLFMHLLAAFALAAGLAVPTLALAGPWVDEGDLGLRDDLEMLADAGVISAPLTTWPLTWASIMPDVNNADITKLNPGEVAALGRVKARMNAQTKIGPVRGLLRASVAQHPIEIRTFEETPRNEGELTAGFQWMGKWAAVRLQATGVVNSNDEDSQDDRDVYADGSYLSGITGNWIFSAAQVDRWWGPGYEGSLILSNNARPVPALVVQRNNTHGFDSKWLRWLGTWSFVAFNGWLEEDRDVPNAMLFGMRFSFKPLKDLEISLSRTAQWGGDGRPSDLNAFWNMIVGKDNPGEQGVTAENEPGNQLAGFDFRWASPFTDDNYAFYLQWIGEDEKGTSKTPSAWMKMGGIEGWGSWGDRGASWRVYFEHSQTITNSRFHVAYNHHLYTDGYRTRGRVIGDSIDNDGKIYSLGGMVTGPRGWHYNVRLRYGDLNQDSDRNNSVTVNATDWASVELTSQFPIPGGRLHYGLGYEQWKDKVLNETDDEVRAFLEYKSFYW
jgi:hypothetical protein